MNPQYEVIKYLDMAMHEIENAKKSNYDSEEDSYQDTKHHLRNAIELTKIALENAELNECRKKFRKLLNKD